MKYLKTYEDIQNEYKIGDYILLGYHDSEKYKAKIIDKLPVGTRYTGEWGEGEVETEYEYKIVYIARNDFFHSSFNSTAMNTLVRRFLTPEEIEEFKFVEATRNYNL